MTDGAGDEVQQEPWPAKGNAEVVTALPHPRGHGWTWAKSRSPRAHCTQPHKQASSTAQAGSGKVYQETRRDMTAVGPRVTSQEMSRTNYRKHP